MNSNIRQILLAGVAIVGVLQSSAQPAGMARADSLFFAQNWSAAEKLYSSLLKDTSRNGIAWNRLGFSAYNLGNYDAAMKSFKKALQNSPGPGLKASVYSRMAKLQAVKGIPDEALENLDSAVANGYINTAEMDTLTVFQTIRKDERFKQIRQRAFLSANPCMSNALARQFDFWIGEWNVYPTGTNTLVGHSLIQMVSGGCALLENWEATGGASNGKSLNFIDPATQKWRQTWVGSYANGQQDFVEGEYSNGAMRFVFTGKDAQGHPLNGRFIFFNEGPDKVRQFNETSSDGGKTWMTSYDLTYIRIK